jgi:hypothetical protein
MVPVEPPLHKILVELPAPIAKTAEGLVTVAEMGEIAVWQPLLSVITTLYVPAERPVIFCVVAV